MSEQLEKELARELRHRPIDDEAEAERRSWTVVRAAFAERQPISTRRRWGRIGGLAAMAAAVAAIGLTPAGAQVREWINDAIDPSSTDPRPALTRLPAAGRILTEGGSGPWIVNRDGSRRYLGDYEEASWSPNGLFLITADGRQLEAVEPNGTPRWGLSHRKPVHVPRWSGLCCRIAYLAGSQLRIVEGDGSDDRRLAGFASTAPAWRPRSDTELAFVDGSGDIRVVRAPDGRVLERIGVDGDPVEIAWSFDGRALLVLLSNSVLRVDLADGRPLTTRLLDNRPVSAATFLRRSDQIAVITRRGRPSGGTSSLVSLLSSAGGQIRERRIFETPGALDGLATSSDGRWLVTGWRDADQWIFLEPRAGGELRAVEGVSAAFGNGSAPTSGFVSPDSWCCPPG